MKTFRTSHDYFALPATDKAALTSEEVERVGRLILMENGVLDATPPDLLPEELPKLETEQLFGISYRGDYGSETDLGIVFRTHDEAQRFLDSGAMRAECDYRLPSRCATTIPLQDARVVIRVLAKPEAVAAARQMLERIAQNKQANEKARKQHEEATSEVEKATRELWADWHTAKDRARHLERIKAKFAEYCELTNDDRHVARRFLEKAFPGGDIQEAIGDLGCRPQEMAAQAVG